MSRTEPSEIVRAGSMSPEAAREIIERMHEGGINFVSLLPESEFMTAQRAVVEDSRFKCVPVCNEMSAVCICAGAWVGGKKPALMVGAAGFTVASYPFAGVCIRHGVPMLLLVTSRELGDENWIFNIWNRHTVEPFFAEFGLPVCQGEQGFGSQEDGARCKQDVLRMAEACGDPVDGRGDLLGRLAHDDESNGLRGVHNGSDSPGRADRVEPHG